MSSPSTLVCPAKEAIWDRLPWFSEKEGKLISPTQDLEWLTKEEAEQLYSWLDQLKQNLNNLGNGRGSRDAINVILSLVGDFQKRLEVGPELTVMLELCSKVLGDEIKIGGIEILNKPIKPTSVPSSVLLYPKTEPPVYIIPNPPELMTTREAKSIEQQWGVKSQQIRIHDTDTIDLGTLNRKRLPKLASQWQLEWIGEGKQPELPFSKGTLIDAGKLLLEDFYFIPQGNVLPGGVLPSGVDSLTYEGNPLTPLLPINPFLLDYLSTEDLRKRMTFEKIDGERKVRVKLRLFLSGVKGYGPRDYEIQKDYPLKKDNALEVPILELWPNFQGNGWKEYYLFYWNGDKKEQAFEVRLPSQVQTASVQFPRNKSLPSRYEISQLDQFPDFLTCQDIRGKDLGLILLPPPPQVGQEEPTNWIVGFDFGTSMTNVLFELKTVGNVGIPTKFNESNWKPLNLKITQGTQTKAGTLEEAGAMLSREYFPFYNLQIPLATILTTRGSSKQDQEKSEKVLDGRIYPPDISDFPIWEPYYHPNLKWSPEFPNFPIMFLEHLALMLSAEAVRKNARSITWCISYPSAFSDRDQQDYKATWKNITDKLNTTTGIQHSFNQVQENQFNYLTESSAVAQFFADPAQECRLANTVFIDIGGGTSDISIWEDWQPVYQSSLKIASHDLFIQFLRQHLDVLDLLFDPADINQTPFSPERREDLNQRDLPAAKVDCLLDIVMSVWGEKLLAKRNMVQSNEDKEKVKTFQKIIQLTELAIAGLYYYVGLLLRYLRENGDYKMPILPDVYIAGNGSRIFDWLSNQGEYVPKSSTNKILRQVLIQSSGLKQGSGKTVLSRRPKDEVAFGLVSAQKNPLPEFKPEGNYYLAGEVCSLGESNLNWDSKLDLTSRINGCAVGNLEIIPEFLLGFYLTWKKYKEDDEERRILTNYNPSAEIEENPEIWDEVKLEMRNKLDEIMINKDPKLIQFEPPFIVGLKALLKVLSK